MLAWLHDLSPVAVEILGFPIRWYGISYALGFFLGWLALYGLARKGFTPVPPERTADMVVTIAIAGVLGGRLGYVLIYQPSLITDIGGGFPWWGVLRINEGGMASHGGIIGAVVGALLFSRGTKDDEGHRVHQIPAWHVIDLMAALAPIGLFLGRLANFVNAELLGRIVTQPASGEPAPWWAVRYPQEWLTDHDAGVERTPEQTDRLYALIDAYRGADKNDFQAYERIIARLQAGDADLATRLAPLISARHPSQLYQAFAEGVVLLAALWFIWWKPRKPGVIGSWFLILYGIGRVTTEFWRLPDAHLAVQRVAGLSRGQWLRVVMVVIGLAMLTYVSRRPVERLGGWRRTAS